MSVILHLAAAVPGQFIASAGLMRENSVVKATPKEKEPADAEKMRRKAFARWEGEGGAIACGPQVPGVEKDCEGEGEK